MQRQGWFIWAVGVVALLLPCAQLRAGCTITWDGGAGTSAWNNALNWDTNVVPGPGDDACIPAGATVIFNTGTITVNSLTSNGFFTISAGSLTLASASQINGDFIFSGGTLTGAGDLAVTGTFDWSAGTMAGTGQTTISAGATIDISGPAVKGLSRTLINFGSASWSGGQIQLSNCSFNNKPGATFDISGSNSMSGSIGTNAFNNEGFMTRSGAGLTNFFSNNASMAFNNLDSGDIQVTGGTLTLSKGGALDGSISITGSGALSLNASITFGAGSMLDGDGSITFLVGTHTLTAGTFAFTGAISVSGGTATINDALSLSSLTISAGSISANGGPSNIGNLAISGGTLGGSAELTINTSASWTGGIMSGSGKTVIPSSVALDMSSVNGKNLGRTIDNYGPATWSGGQIQYNNGTLNIKPGASFDITANVSMSGGTGTNAFNNEGTCTKSSAGLVQLFSNNATMAFNNLGIVNITAGTLSIIDGGFNSGSIIINSGATLLFSDTFTYNPASSIDGAGNMTFQGGTHNIPAGTFAVTGNITGAGAQTATINDTVSLATVSITSGTLNLNGGPSTANALLLSAGTLGGSADLTITNSASWTGGGMSGSGKTIIPNSVALDISSANGKNLGRNIDNYGPAVWSGGQIQYNNGTLNIKPGALFDITGNVSMSGSTGINAFNNEGACTKSSAGLVQVFSNNATMAFNNAGNVNILNGTLSVSSAYTQTAGSTILNGGTLTKLNSAIALQGGTLGGVGTLTGAVSATGGTVAPGLSPGLFNITGNLTRSAASTLDIELGGLAAGTEHDRLAVSGTATLAGTLRLHFVNGFTPASGNTFTILTAGTRNGTFSNVDVVGYPDCFAQVQYTPGSVIVQIDPTPPNTVCQDVTLNLDAKGQASITAAQINNGSTDNCEIASIEINQTDFDCDDIGNNTVLLTVTDHAGNQATCAATVTVQDVTPPTVICKDITIALPGSAPAGLSPEQVYDSGSDNCGTVKMLFVTPSAFSCANIGPNIVTLWVDDGHGNSSSCQATVTVQDNTPPIINCQNITISLDDKGAATVAPDEVYVSGSDNCGTVNLALVKPNSFTCSNLGENLVTLTANDGHGNQTTCQAIVTVEDTTAPILSCQDYALMLDRSGNGTLLPSNVFAAGSDNCGTVNLLSVEPNAFTCKDVGALPIQVTLTVDDGHGNIATCLANVTVIATGRYQGSPNGSWFSGGNWCGGGLPDQKLDVSLDVPVLIDQIGAEALSVTILNGGDLIVGNANPGPGGSIAVDGAITVESGGALSIIQSGTVFASSLTLESGATLNITTPTSSLGVQNLTVHPGATVNWTAGAIEINGGAWTNPPGTIISIGCDGQNALLFLMSSATVAADHMDVCALGSIHGNGTLIAASVSNAGEVHPGSVNAAGTLNITGAYLQAANGGLTIELGGIQPNIEHDQLVITGSAQLAGALELTLINDFAPTVGNTFNIISATQVQGAFDTVLGSPDTCGKLFAVSLEPGLVQVETIYDTELRDCNVNTVPDQCDLLFGTSLDCNTNLIPDECDIASQTSADCNANNIPDECDIASGQSFDCNLNAVPDSCDLDSGVSVDLNNNTVPDECERCALGDITCNGIVDVDDLLYVINSWGLCNPGLACPADLAPPGPPAGNGVVDVDDLLVVINNWG